MGTIELLIGLLSVVVEIGNYPPVSICPEMNMTGTRCAGPKSGHNLECRQYDTIESLTMQRLVEGKIGLLVIGYANTAPPSLTQSQSQSKSIK
ncbi:hypothetical protein [Desulfonatronum thiosulfatophilum]|uniref:hypothetical protein n=1 Tax=Desulfonatronum thiosulfatophilum TaxID=617002 RepID=UPI001113717F|nr:hypothetical protein [Desulfonatronum thiosulfatophilum]